MAVAVPTPRCWRLRPSFGEVRAVRDWMTPRFILVAALLVAAPGAAVAHLLATWLPDRLAVAELQEEIATTTCQLETEWAQSERFQQEVDQLRQRNADNDDASRIRWLLQRDRDAVFDRIADAFRDERVSIEQLTLDEPALYAAVSASNLLASERIMVKCSGDYGALAACLDQVTALEIPVRIQYLNWSYGHGDLELEADLDVPFVPDAALRDVLAQDAGLEDDADES